MIKKNCKINGENILDVIITQEKINNKTFYVAQGIQIEVASQGLSIQEALENIKDAAEIVIENNSRDKEKIEIAPPMLTRIFF